MEYNQLDKKLRHRQAPLEMTSQEFRSLGHQLVDRIAEFLDSLPRRPVTPGGSPQDIRAVLGADNLPDQGMSAAKLLEEVPRLLFDHSLFNGHPRFWGYITSSASPLGALSELLASAVNPNLGAWPLAPMASEIEAQTIRWLADLIGFPNTCSGLLLSGGNMANFVGFLAARKAQVSWDIRVEGLVAGSQRLTLYVSQETHTWIQKAADIFGLGTSAIRWIATDARQQMDVKGLENQIVADREEGYLPFLVVGTAGTVSTGATDPLPDVAAVCRQHKLWFHVDGAYGAPAAALPEAPPQLKGLSEADSVALDPHKWLYSPIEAGCILVRNPQHLIQAFSFHPEYYNFLDGAEEESPINYYEMGPQNSRGFRALKVWLGLRRAGREGCVQMIRDDIALAQALFELADMHPELQAVTHNLSITTFRFVPLNLPDDPVAVNSYLNDLNKELLNRLQGNGEAYVSNAIVEGKYCLRACIVNFRTTLNDIEAFPGIVVRLGRTLDNEMRPAHLKIS